MSTDVGKLKIRLVADGEGLGDSINEAVNKEAGRADGALRKAGERYGRAILAGAVAVGIKGVMDFTAFERQMNEVFTLLPGISGDAMSEMTDQVKNFATEFGVLPTEVVPALYQSLSAGVPQDNVFAFLETAQQAARGGVTDLETAVDGITSTINAYGTDVLSATEASDLMFTSVKLGKTTFDELSRSLFQVNPTAAALGVEFSDVTAALAALTAQGVPTSVATTQLRQLFVELSKESSQTSAIFQELAGKSFKDFVEAGGNTQDALQLLEQYAADAGLGINDLFGSVEAGSAALALTGGGTEKFTDALEGMQESAGATEAAFEQMQKGLGPVFDRFRANLSVALIEIGEKIAPSVAVALEGLTLFLEFFKSLPGPVQASIIGLVGIAAATLALAGPVMKAAGAVKAMGTAIGGVTKLLATNPYVLLIAATVALVILIVKNWDTIKEAIATAVEWIVEKLTAAWNWIRDTSTAIWNGIVEFFRQWWPLLLGVMTGGIGLVVGLIIQNWDVIWAKTQEIWAAIKEWVSGRIEDVKNAIGGLISKGQEIVDFFAGLPAAVSGAWEQVKQWTGQAVDWLKTKLAELAAAADRALGPLDEIVGGAARIGGAVVGGIGNILGFDDGGVVPGPRGAPRLILAHGGETMVPTHRMDFAAAAESIGVGAATGGAPINFNAPLIGQATIGSDMDIEHVARELAYRQERELRARGIGATR
jgi:TP901 family phage tail tape measure protein